jgi:hypothetical protein
MNANSRAWRGSARDDRRCTIAFQDADNDRHLEGVQSEEPEKWVSELFCVLGDCDAPVLTFPHSRAQATPCLEGNQRPLHYVLAMIVTTLNRSSHQHQPHAKTAGSD